MADEIKKVEKEIEKETKKIFKNYWAVATIILAILLIVVLVINYTSGISKAQAGQKIIEFAQSKGINATVTQVNDMGSVYEVVVQIQGQETPVYITKDGKNLVAGLYPLTTTPTPANNTNQEVPKSDKPVMDLYVFAYCPYGTQTEKAFIPVYNLLKSKVDFNIVFIGAMHGDFERVESLRQLSILKMYGKDKYFAYLDQFLASTAIGNCNGDAACLSPLLDGIMKQVGISKADIDATMNSSQITSLYSAAQAQASKLGIGSSPTMVINGVQVQVDRTPAAIEQAVCNAFNTAPNECQTALSSQAMTPGFGNTAGSSSGASCNTPA